MIKTFEDLENIDFTKNEIDVALDKELISETIVKILRNSNEGLKIENNITRQFFYKHTREKLIEIYKEMSKRSGKIHHLNDDEWRANHYHTWRNEKDHILSKENKSYYRTQNYVSVKFGNEEIDFNIICSKSQQQMACTYGSGVDRKTNVKTLKMTDEKVTLNQQWILSQLEVKEKIAKDTNGEKKVDEFRKQLIQTWMLDKLIEEANIPSDWITLQHSSYQTYFTIRYICTRHQHITIVLDKNFKEDNFEMRKWFVTLGKQYLSKPMFYPQVVSLLKILHETGNIKNEDKKQDT